MAPSTASVEAHRGVPSAAADAVLKVSAPLPKDVREVRGIDFDDYKGKDITVGQLVADMGSMGFQASAVSEAARIINGMVGTRSDYGLNGRRLKYGAAAVQRCAG